MALLMEETNVSLSRGMNDSAPATAFQPDEVALLLNYRVTPVGEGEVRNGSKRRHTTALNGGARGYGATAFTTAAGVTQWVVFAGDKGYYSEDEGGSWTELATGLDAAYWDFATMQIGGTNYLYCANGDTTMFRWTGAAWSTVVGPTTGCTRVEVHNERLWTTNGKNLYASKASDPATWASPDGVVVPFNTHDGDSAVIALYSMGSELLVFKRKSFGYVAGYGNADVISNAGSRGISRDVGCIAFRSLVGIGGAGVMFLSERGFEFYAPGLQPTLVSRSVETFLRSINWSAIQTTPGIPCAYFYPRKFTYECALPGNAGQNDQVFCYRLPVGDRPGAASLFDAASPAGQAMSIDADGFLVMGGDSRISVASGFLELVPSSESGSYADISSGFLAVASNNTTSAAVFNADVGTATQAPISVGYDGFVRQLDTGTLDDVTSTGTGGTAIADRLKSRPMVFGDPLRRKRARTARVLVTAQTTVTPSVKIVADGASGTAHTVTVTTSTGDEPAEKRVRVSERGRVLHLQVTNAGAGTKIGGVAIGAERLAERP